MSDVATRLAHELAGDVLFDDASRGRYSTDASIYQIMPVGVVIPRNQADLQLAVDIARDAKVPVLARGAGTSQCGQTVGEAIILDTSRWLNQIVEFDEEKQTVVVEPGLVLDDLKPLAQAPWALVPG
ncbi:MAG: FAD-binding oxidoreductase [Marinobacter sp.]|nr:FAD-binding oxidoreductase [Marinobacter sp.]